MLTVIDRYILRSLLVNYLVALGTMLGLYVVLDLFLNMDEFTEAGYPAGIVIRNIGSYYGPNLLLYFSQLSGVITLFACMATLARMRKAHELTAVLASGVSLYRVAAPVIGFGIAMTALLVIDTEWLIPSVAAPLARDHDDADGSRAYAVLFLGDRDGALLSAARFHPTRKDLDQLLVLQRDAQGDVSGTLEADHATWEPPDPVHPTGRWRLERGRWTIRVRRHGQRLGPHEDKRVTYPTYYDSDLTPDAIQMRQSENWVRFLSLSQLRDLENRAGPSLATQIIQTRHARRIAPVVGLILVLLGLPFFLDRTPGNILSAAAQATLTCGLCYVVAVVSQMIRPESASALPAWIPVFVFGTLAAVLVDRIRT